MKFLMLFSTVVMFSQISAAQSKQGETQWIQFKGYQAFVAYQALSSIPETHSAGKLVTKSAANIVCSRAEDETLIDAYDCSLQVSFSSNGASLNDIR